MSKRSIRTGLSLFFLLAATLFTNQVIADWSGDKLHRGYNQRFGDFPPIDIDRRLSQGIDTEKKEQLATAPTDVTAKAPTRESAGSQPVTEMIQTNPAQQPQHTAYGNYYQYQNYAAPGRQRYNRGSNYSGPWNNSRSGFSGPWSNNGSGFSGPWNNNRGSGFSGPWNNNGSSFNMPWNNSRSGSGFRPWGNGSSWSW